MAELANLAESWSISVPQVWETSFLEASLCWTTIPTQLPSLVTSQPAIPCCARLLLQGSAVVALVPPVAFPVLVVLVVFLVAADLVLAPHLGEEVVVAGPVLVRRLVGLASWASTRPSVPRIQRLSSTQVRRLSFASPPLALPPSLPCRCIS